MPLGWHVFFSIFEGAGGRAAAGPLDHGPWAQGCFGWGGGVQRQGLGRGDSWGGDRAGSCGCDH